MIITMITTASFCRFQYVNDMQFFVDIYDVTTLRITRTARTIVIGAAAHRHQAIKYL